MAICYIFNPLYTVIFWTSLIVILGMSGLFCRFYSFFDGKTILANNADPDQIPYSTPHDVASDQSLHSLLINLLRFPGKSE